MLLIPSSKPVGRTWQNLGSQGNLLNLCLAGSPFFRYFFRSNQQRKQKTTCFLPIHNLLHLQLCPGHSVPLILLLHRLSSHFPLCMANNFIPSFK